MYIIIAGCSNVGRTAAFMFAEQGHNVVVVDKDSDALKSLGSGFNGVTLQGTAIDEDALIKAGIKDADVFIAVTRDENINIMSAQIAQKIFNVKKVIARVVNPAKDKFYKEKLNINTISQTDLCIQAIRHFIEESDIKFLCDLGNEFHVIEFDIKKVANNKRKVKDTISRKFTINVMVRNYKTFIPDLETELAPGDKIIATAHGGYIENIKNYYL